MWLALIGGPGTCKGAIAAALAKDGWMLEREGLPLGIGAGEVQEHAAVLQTHYLTARWRLQRQLQRRGVEEDVVQVRTFWDTHEVYLPALVEQRYLKTSEAHILTESYRALSEVLEPPHIVVNCFCSKMAALDRLKITGAAIHSEEYLDAVRSGYDRYLKKIRVPVVDLDTGRPFDAVMDELRTELTAIKASRPSGGTIWQRSYLIEGREVSDDAPQA